MDTHAAGPKGNWDGSRFWGECECGWYSPAPTFETWDEAAQAADDHLIEVAAGFDQSDLPRVQRP